jgi:hypothetical protein
MELEFRAWDKENKKYIYPDLFSNEMPSNWRDLYEIEQYTGVKDKNGKKIYIGDIMMCDTKCFPVCKPHTGVWQFIGLRFTFLSTDSGCGHGPLYEIAGNMHENVELLL